MGGLLSFSVRCVWGIDEETRRLLQQFADRWDDLFTKSAGVVLVLMLLSAWSNGKNPIVTALVFCFYVAVVVGIFYVVVSFGIVQGPHSTNNAPQRLEGIYQLRYAHSSQPGWRLWFGDNRQDDYHAGSDPPMYWGVPYTSKRPRIEIRPLANGRYRIRSPEFEDRGYLFCTGTPIAGGALATPYAWATGNVHPSMDQWEIDPITPTRVKITNSLYPGRALSPVAHSKDGCYVGLVSGVSGEWILS